MTSKYPKEIHDLVPEEFRDHYGIYYSKLGDRYHVYRDVGYVYKPEKKRSSSIREPLGSIKDGQFRYSPKYLAQNRIRELESENRSLRQTSDRGSVKTVAETLEQFPSKAGALNKLTRAAKGIKDPRQDKKIIYPMNVLMTVFLLAALAGYTSAVSIAIYWRKNRSELEQLIQNFPQENITHDTVNRVLRLIDPKQFHSVLVKLSEPLIVKAAERLIHIDGQAVVASKLDDNDKGTYAFNVYDSDNGVVLSSSMIGAKQNEISVAVDVMKSIDLHEGDMVTADAMNTQRKLVEYLQSKGVGYCLATKENQPKLISEIRHLFDTTDVSRRLVDKDIDSGHGRIETRIVTVIPARLLSETFLESWPGLKQGCLVRVENITQAKSKRERDSYQVRYFMTSLTYKTGAPKRAGEIVRRHWSVENEVHWVLDATFGQDRIHCTHSTYLANRVVLNKIRLNLLRAAQKVITSKFSNRYSMATMEQLCNTPSGAIENLALAFDVSKIFDKVKD